jgi:hypothetical protein
VASKSAKITALPPTRPLWLIDVPTEALLNEKPVGIEEVCKELDVNRVTVVAYVLGKEKLPGKKMGGRWEFYMSLVRAWRANRQLQ